jgi:hypothetical protein
MPLGSCRICPQLAEFIPYSVCNSFSKVALCFSFFRFFRLGTIRCGGGVPSWSRAIALTITVALSSFFLRFLATSSPSCHSLCHVKLQ